MVAVSIDRVETECSFLRVKNVKKDFPSSDRTIARTLALDTVSFSVAAGEFVSVVALLKPRGDHRKDFPSIRPYQDAAVPNLERAVFDVPGKIIFASSNE